jgi:hypothetical protein
MSDSGGGIPIFWIVIAALWFFGGDDDMDEEATTEAVTEVLVSQGLVSDADRYPGGIDRVAEATAHLDSISGDTAIADGTATKEQFGWEPDTVEVVDGWGW